MAGWHYGIDGGHQGPVGLGEIQAMMASGMINTSTLVWREGMERWLPLGQVPELMQAPAPGGAVAVPGYAPPVYGGGAYPGAPVAPSNGQAIASLVCGVMSLVLLFSCAIGILAAIPAVICGHLGLKQIRESELPQAGRGMAITGLITGYLTILFTLCFAAFIGIVIANDL